MSPHLMHGDCRDVLPRRFASESFDACITDPPYGDTSLEWDRVCTGWLAEVVRVLKPSASIWVFGSMRSLIPLFVEMESLGFRYSQDIVWEKQNGTGFHNDRFRRVHEHAVMFYRGAWADVFHDPQFTDDATARTVRRKTRPTHTGHIDASGYESFDGGPRLERSVQFCPNEHGRAIHPTQKPIDLLRTLIRYSVPPGGSVIDPFGGSCSTAMAARAEGRQGTCIEIDVDMLGRASEWMHDGPLFCEEAA